MCKIATAPDRSGRGADVECWCKFAKRHQSKRMPDRFWRSRCSFDVAGQSCGVSLPAPGVVDARKSLKPVHVPRQGRGKAATLFVCASFRLVERRRCVVCSAVRRAGRAARGLAKRCAGVGRSASGERCAQSRVWPPDCRRWARCGHTTGDTRTGSGERSAGRARGESRAANCADRAPTRGTRHPERCHGGPAMSGMPGWK